MQIAVLGNDDFVTGFRLSGVSWVFSSEGKLDAKVEEDLGVKPLGSGGKKDILPAQRKDQEHVRGPDTDALQSGQNTRDFFIRHGRQGAEVNRSGS